MTTKEKKEFVFELLTTLEADRTNCHEVADIFEEEHKEEMAMKLRHQALGVGSAIADILSFVGIDHKEYIEYKMKQYN